MLALLKKMESAWNSGDLDGFLECCWNDPAFIFVSGADRTDGWVATASRYREHYPSAEKMGRVTYTEITERQISDTVGTILCRWTLDFGDHSHSGLATFVFEKLNGEWVTTFEHAAS